MTSHTNVGLITRGTLLAFPILLHLARLSLIKRLKNKGIGFILKTNP